MKEGRTQTILGKRQQGRREGRKQQRRKGRKE